MNKKEEEKKGDRRTFYSTRMQKADATATTATWATATSATAEPVAVKTFSVVDRFAYTAEVTISKIFPAGFGWQTASVVVDGWGYAGDSFNFAVTTGLGDALGVVAGHVAYYSIKKSVYDSSINMSQELQNGILLATAAFCSGTAWQPIVNVLQGANLPFNSVFFGTWAGCGVAFYLGLRVGRSVLSGPLTYVEEPTYENQKNDASLSIVETPRERECPALVSATVQQVAPQQVAPGPDHFVDVTTTSTTSIPGPNVSPVLASVHKPVVPVSRPRGGHAPAQSRYRMAQKGAEGSGSPKQRVKRSLVVADLRNPTITRY